MELIPILSLIILVSTISTFILAVGAYILYKIRERRGRLAKAKPPETIPAELVEPKSIMAESTRLTKTGDGGLSEERVPTRATTPDLTRTGLRSTRDRTKSTFLTSPTMSTYSEDYFRKTAGATKETFESERFAPRRKFMRYTSEGSPNTQEPEPPVQQKKNREDNLQWR